MTFYKEVDRAMGRIDHHVTNLMEEQEELDEEYESLFQNLLDRAQEFDDDALRNFKKLGRLRKLKKLNLATIASLQYLRFCLWYTINGCCFEWEPKPSLAVEQLRGVNRALQGSPEAQTKRLDRFVSNMTMKLTRGPPDQARNMLLAIRLVDDEVSKIFGEAMSARS